MQSSVAVTEHCSSRESKDKLLNLILSLDYTEKILITLKHSPGGKSVTFLSTAEKGFRNYSPRV